MEQIEKKDHLIKLVKEWVKIDNELKQLRKEINTRKTKEKEISTELMNVMKKYEIDEFNITGGKIMYSKKNVKKPINKKTLIQLLSNYFDGNYEKANDINNYIMDNREEVVKETIVHKQFNEQMRL
jgi:SMC interacting uncharacterized protein involved in chromosome segregation